jgi:signal transduction histidine kinase/ActR/RegA family two-component response regulator
MSRAPGSDDAASEEPREGAATLRLAVDAAGMGTWDWNLVTGELAWSERCLALFGLPPGTAMTYARFLDAIAAEDRDLVDAAAREALAERQPYDVEMRVPWRDGTVHRVRHKGHGVYDLSGRPLRMIGMAFESCSHSRIQDELRARELELIAAQRVAGVGSWSLDLSSGVFSVSEELCRICGRDRGTPPPRLDSNDWGGAPLFAPEDYARAIQAVMVSVGERRPYELEVDMLRPDGSRRTVLARGELVEGPPGRFATMLGTALDVTGRKQTEKALREANQAKDEFLAMLGHELRNPLSPIVTALQILKLGGDGQHHQYQKTLDIVDRQVQHLIRLVDDLLDVARITRGRIKIEKKPVRLQDAVARGAEMAMPLIEQRSHHLDIQVPRSELRLMGDEDRLAQVIANLLTNSAKYTDAGGHIAVRARREADEMVIEVKDDGIGISPELLPRVFDMFTQQVQPKDRATGGLGIGLTIVRNLVELHGGTVAAASEGPGRGSAFTVRLPVGACEPAAVEHVAASAEPVAKTRRRILVVDDNEDALDLLAEVLRGARHDVVTALDGPSALEAVKRFRPDVAVLDIGLPVMDGYELASRIRAELGEAAPELIALTGYGQESDRARTREAGFAEHLTKPVDLGCLLAAIDHPDAATAR